MNDTARDAVIASFCKELKLPRLQRDHSRVARRAADEGWPYEDYLRELLETEVHGRRDTVSNRRLREARFPDVKTLDQIDWKALEGIPRTKIAELASCAYIERGEDVVIAGPIGTGKSHVSIADGEPTLARGCSPVYGRRVGAGDAEGQVDGRLTPSRRSDR